MIYESRFLIPVLALVFVVIGSMYFGWATATEAAAVGVVGAHCCWPLPSAASIWQLSPAA